MQSYEDFLLLSQICMEEARRTDEATAAKLRSLARQYQKHAMRSLNSRLAAGGGVKVHMSWRLRRAALASPSRGLIRSGNKLH
jgi:hypothetical protein